MVMCIISASLAAVMFFLSVLGALIGVPRKVSYRCVCLRSMVAESLCSVVKCYHSFHRSTIASLTCAAER